MFETFSCHFLLQKEEKVKDITIKTDAKQADDGSTEKNVPLVLSPENQGKIIDLINLDQ